MSNKSDSRKSKINDFDFDKRFYFMLKNGIVEKSDYYATRCFYYNHLK